MSFDTKERILNKGDSVIVLDQGKVISGKIVGQTIFDEKNWIEVDINGQVINFECHLVAKVKSRGKNN